MKPDQVDIEESEDNLFSSDEESEEDQNTCSKSGAQEIIRSILTTSGHEKQEDQGVHLESHKVESDDDSWAGSMRHIQTPYGIRTFGTGFPKPITAVHPTPHLSQCEFGTK